MKASVSFGNFGTASAAVYSPDGRTDAKKKAPNARFGDSWVFPILRQGLVVGGVEKWDMGGCVELRSIDLDDESYLPMALNALKPLLEFQSSLGFDLVRVKEVLGVAPDEVPEKVAEVMTKEVVTARAADPLVHAIELMDAAGVNRLPVVDDQDRPVGILARDDVLRAIAAGLRATAVPHPGAPRIEPD